MSAAAAVISRGGAFFLRLRSVALASACCLSFAASAQTASSVPAPVELERAVGLVVCEKLIDGRRFTARGTGTVVASDSTVLTAAHIFATDSRRYGRRIEFDADDCVFQQFDVAGEIVAETSFLAAVFGGYRGNSGLPNEDWAVLQASGPLVGEGAALPVAAIGFGELTSGRTLPIAILSYQMDWSAFAEQRGERAIDREIRREAFSRSRLRIPSYSEGELFEVSYSGFDRLAHTAETDRMSSGAAIVLRDGNGRDRVVGVHRSAARLDDFNLAVPLSEELRTTLLSLAGTAPLAQQAPD